jgi:hypothetical protein
VKAVEERTKYAGLTAEELELRLRESFFCPDRIDETVYRELEELREALEGKRPPEGEPDPEEAWQRFLEDRGEELAALWGPEEPRQAAARPPVRTASALLRRVLIAAAVLVLLAGAALAAGPLGLLAWTPGWNAAAGRYEPAAQEVSGESPIPAALRELGITEPVYPARLPEGFVITESHISEDPLVLMEQYADGDRLLSITVTPTVGFRTAIYKMRGEDYREYASGAGVHYLFRNEGAITAVWYTKNYTTSVSGNLSLAEIKGIIDSLYREGA